MAAMPEVRREGFQTLPDEEKKLLVALKGELAESTIEEANSRYME